MLQGLEEAGNYSVYFDGCKDLPRVELLRTMLADIKLLHVVRHPGAFFYHFHKLGQAGFEKRLGHWMRYNQNAHAFEHLVPPGNYLAITYESIVQQPEKFVFKMEQFFGMDESPARDRTRIHRSQVHIMGNRMRESADRVLDFSNTWRGKMSAPVEEKANDVISQDDWLRSLYEDTDPFRI